MNFYASVFPPVTLLGLALLSSLENRRAFAYDSLPRLISDAVGPLFPAIRVSAHLCRLEPDRAIRLSRLMSSRGLVHEISGTLDGFAGRIHDAWDHRALYVVDLDCEYGVSLLRAVRAGGFDEHAANATYRVALIDTPISLKPGGVIL